MFKIHFIYALIVFIFPFRSFGENLNPHASVAASGDFMSLLNEGLENDPQYEVKKSELRSSELRDDSNLYQFLPDLTLSGGQNHLGDNFERPAVKYQSYLVSSTLNIFKFGADYFAKKSSSAELNSKKWSKLIFELSFESDFSDTLLNYILSKKELVLRQENLKNQTKLLEIAKQRYQQGLLAKQEVDKVTIDTDFIESDLTKTFNRLKSTEAEILKKLKTLPEKIDWPWAFELERFKPQSLELEDHPRYLAQKMNLRSAQSDYHQTQGQFWGSLDLNFQWSRNNLVGNEFANQATTSLMLTIPLFNRMKDVTAKKLAYERLIQQESGLNSVMQDLKNNVIRDESIFISQQESYRKKMQILLISRALLSDNTSRFRQGRISVNELSIDQNRVYQSELLALGSLYDAHVALKNLCKTYGKRLTNCFQK